MIIVKFKNVTDKLNQMHHISIEMKSKITSSKVFPDLQLSHLSYCEGKRLP